MVFFTYTIQIYTHQIRILYALIYIVFALQLPKLERHYCALLINDPKLTLKKLILTKKSVSFYDKTAQKTFFGFIVLWLQKVNIYKR